MPFIEDSPPATQTNGTEPNEGQTNDESTRIAPTFMSIYSQYLRVSALNDFATSHRISTTQLNLPTIQPSDVTVEAYNSNAQSIELAEQILESIFRQRRQTLNLSTLIVTPLPTDGPQVEQEDERPNSQSTRNEQNGGG